MIHELKKRHNDEIHVAVTPHCKDALYNIPWVDRVIEIPNMWHGISEFKKLQYKHIYQITQNVKFFEFKQTNQNHSLIDTPLSTGLELGLPAFDQRPMFLPTQEELQFGHDYGQLLQGHPTIAVECIAKSAQSWADQIAIDKIVNKYASTHKILWLSNQGTPHHPNVDNLLRYTRRQIIMLLQHCEIFFSVGSGFFCANLALPVNYQAKRVVCLWIDDLYKYENRLVQLQWHKDITWIHNHQELQKIIES